MGCFKFPLQYRAWFGTVDDVRMTVAFMVFFAGTFAAFAQDQERKLVDRLLRPNTVLANPAQNKKFSAPGTFVHKSARTKSFYSPAKPPPKTFPTNQSFPPRQFAARHFRAGHSAAEISARSQLTRSDTIYPTSDYPVRTAPGSSATVAPEEFSGTRPFLGQGKSQKALHAHNKPLTVEQVRELLNKNK